MLDQNFCSVLEYALSRQLKSVGMWCDGVLLPLNEQEYSEKTVNDKREVILSAFAGKSGQEIFEVKLIFGNKSLSRYSRDLGIEECIPILNENYMRIDSQNQKIEIQLL